MRSRPRTHSVMNPDKQAPSPIDVRGEFEQALRGAGAERVELRLYVSGCTANSVRAIADFQRLCHDHLSERCDIEIIDIYQQPERAVEAQIVAVPTLIKNAPQPVRRLVGSLAETITVLKTLGLSA
jgi:circadian clock protein KaiB